MKCIKKLNNFYMDKSGLGYALKKFSHLNPRTIPTLWDNCYVYLTQKKAGRGPISIIWNITSACNLKCTFCDWWKVGHANWPNQKELNTQKKLEIIKKIAKAGVGILSFCGGEPLVCPDLELLIKEAKKYKIFVNISTNGLLLEEKAEMLVRAGVDFITISIDSSIPRVHDQLRGYNGLSDKITQGIKAVRKLSKIKLIYLEARYLINKLNYSSIEDFVRIWNGRVDCIMFKPIYERPSVLYRNPPNLKFEPQNEERFRDYFNTFLRKYKKFNTPYNRHIPNFLFRPYRLNGKFLCFAGIFFGTVDPQGNLYPCQELTAFSNKSLGNILEEDFMNLWNCNQIREVRSHFKHNGRCNCWMERFSLSIYIQKFLKPVDKLLHILTKYLENVLCRQKTK